MMQKNKCPRCGRPTKAGEPHKDPGCDAVAARARAALRTAADDMREMDARAEEHASGQTARAS